MTLLHWKKNAASISTQGSSWKQWHKHTCIFTIFVWLMAVVSLQNVPQKQSTGFKKM
jgi:hypothetical protein